MLFKNNYKKNLKRFWFYIDEIIDRANEKYPTLPDCRPLLKEKLDTVVSNSKDQIKNWNASTNVEMYAYKILFNFAFDILSSGKLHIYRGMLNPMNCGQKLLYIVDESLDYYLRNGIATEDDVKEQKKLLHDNMSWVG